MRPADPSAAELKVIRWFFGIAFAVAVVVIAFMAYARVHECTAHCHSRGFRDGLLHLNSGSRLNIGTHCECIDPNADDGWQP